MRRILGLLILEAIRLSAIFFVAITPWIKRDLDLSGQDIRFIFTKWLKSIVSFRRRLELFTF